MKHDQKSITVGTKSIAALYLEGVGKKLSRGDVLRKAGGFTVYDAEKTTGITAKRLRQQFTRENLPSELALDGDTLRESRFYFPPGVKIPPK